MKKSRIILFSFFLFMCVGCSDTTKNISVDENNSEEKVSEIIIPESYLNFTNQDTDDLAESFEEYCQNVKINGASILIEITETQRKQLINIYDEYIDRVINNFESINDKYKCEVSNDYGNITYNYDEYLYEKDMNENTHIEGELLTGVISSCAMNQILKSNNQNWEISIIVKNCHTGNTVAETVLPEGKLFIGNDEWINSY